MSTPEDELIRDSNKIARDAIRDVLVEVRDFAIQVLDDIDKIDGVIAEPASEDPA
jgi:hypothetical protein